MCVCGGGGRLGLQAKKGRPDGGPILGPMLKSLHRGTKGGGVGTPWTPPPPPPGSATDIGDSTRILAVSLGILPTVYVRCACRL